MPDRPEDRDEASPRARMGRLIMALRAQGVTSPKVLNAIVTARASEGYFSGVIV